MDMNTTREKRSSGCLLGAAASTVILALVSGCGATPSVDRDRGTSVRNMIQGQIYDMNASLNPPAAAPEGMDGTKAIKGLDDIYRGGEAEDTNKATLKQRVWTDRIKF